VHEFCSKHDIDRATFFLSGTPDWRTASFEDRGHNVSAAASGESANGGVPVKPAPLWLLALITFSGTLAMHVFVPALPQAARDLSASPGSMQLTVSFYILGLAVGQLFYGPLSDRYGRRPVLMVGLALYTVAGLAAGLAPDAHFLIAARLFQALGGCAGLVLGRAIVRDGAGLTDATRRLALMNLLVIVGPALAPLIGSALAEAVGWRSIFVVLCGLGLVNSFLTWRILPETARTGAGQDTRVVMRNYRQLISSPVFLGYAVGGGCATTSMYAFISAAPFVFIDELKRPSHEVGIYLALVVLGAWIGNLAATRLVGRVVIDRLIVRGSLISLVGAVLLLGAASLGHLTVTLVMIAVMLFTIGAGVAGAPALAEALSVNPAVAGSASGLYGFVQMAIGAICTSLAGFGGDPAFSSGVVLVGAALAAQICFAIALHMKRRSLGQGPSAG
jgi:DHA1 family bicyclomycin/chloramphenicol resistance-like MFS transporter